MFISFAGPLSVLQQQTSNRGSRWDAGPGHAPWQPKWSSRSELLMDSEKPL